MAENFADNEEVLKQIESYVFDENKIVTYKYLSRTLGIHPERAKQCLQQFLQNHKKQSGNVCGSFLVSGVSKCSNDVKVHKFIIVLENNIEKAKRTMDQVTCQHIYSVQQGETFDLNNLYAADYASTDALVEHILKWKIIMHESARTRTEDEMRMLKIPVRLAESKKKQAVQGTTSSTFHNAKALQTSLPQTNQEGSSKTSSAQQEKSSKPKIPNMFMKQASVKKQSTVKDNAGEGEKSQENSTKIKSPPVKKGSMMAYFMKDDEQTKAETVKAEISNTTEQMPVKEAENGQKVNETPIAKASSQHVSKKIKCTPNSNSSAKEVSSSSSGDFKKSHKGQSKPQGKHKRIVSVLSSSSESESDDEDMRSESPLPPPTNVETDEEAMDTDSEEPIPPTPPVQKTTTRKKLVTETFEDENGFLVTKKVWQNVSEAETPPAPANDEARKASPENAKCSTKTEKKASPPSLAGKKQVSLMSFFKKKEMHK